MDNIQESQAISGSADETIQTMEKINDLLNDMHNILTRIYDNIDLL
ncbi:MAG: hypothetical protein H6Q13_3475 [Bacteroidetes bacterium]|nr:hypothetical protein [Bacteroidota bacterium]